MPLNRNPVPRPLDAGINFIGTADQYSHGESEVSVGKALAGGRRDDIVLASKVRMPISGPRFDLSLPSTSASSRPPISWPNWLTTPG
jgi:aryl-alcohol dehydrogenase-like predicted oxidoreductase